MTRSSLDIGRSGSSSADLRETASGLVTMTSLSTERSGAGQLASSSPSKLRQVKASIEGLRSACPGWPRRRV